MVSLVLLCSGSRHVGTSLALHITHWFALILLAIFVLFCPLSHRSETAELVPVSL